MRIKIGAPLLLIALVFIALESSTIYFARQLKSTCTGVGVRIADAPVPERKLSALAAEADGGLTLTAAWSRGKKTTVSADGMDTALKARPVTVYGDVKQIAPLKLLAGSCPVGDDYGGCLITADVGMALFHSADAVEARVLLDGRRYTVRGVVSAYEPMIIVRGANRSYENLEFAVDDPSVGANAVSALLYRLDLSSDYAVLQYGLYARMLYGLAYLPLALILLSMAARLIKQSLRRRGRALLLLLPAAIALALSMLIFKKTFYWPQSFLPTKCSDFAFWDTLFRSLRETYRNLSLITPLPKDAAFYRAARYVLFGSVLTLAAGTGFVRSLKNGLEKYDR